VVKVRDGAHVRNKAAHIAVGVDMEGIKHVLGIWVQTAEGAKFWAGVCAELANRGVADVLIVCCDGLTGFPEAIEATWPKATVQTCVVHYSDLPVMPISGWSVLVGAFSALLISA
jgi:transposase-like protein